LSSVTEGKSGLELLQQAITGKLPTGPLLKTLGCALVEVTDGFARFELASTEELHSPVYALHGGVLSTLLDAAMGAAVLTTLDGAKGYSTVTLTVHLTRAITARTGKMAVEGWVVHRGSRLVTAEGRLTDEQGRLLAHASATCAVIERPSS
jgi:uncharacterized protein (TIGR00369 family)